MISIQMMMWFILLFIAELCWERRVGVPGYWCRSHTQSRVQSYTGRCFRFMILPRRILKSSSASFCVSASLIESNIIILIFWGSRDGMEWVLVVQTSADDLVGHEITAAEICTLYMWFLIPTEKIFYIHTVFVNAPLCISSFI